MSPQRPRKARDPLFFTWCHKSPTLVATRLPSDNIQKLIFQISTHSNVLQHSLYQVEMKNKNNEIDQSAMSHCLRAIGGRQKG